MTLLTKPRFRLRGLTIELALLSSSVTSSFAGANLHMHKLKCSSFQSMLAVLRLGIALTFRGWRFDPNTSKMQSDKLENAAGS